MNIGWSALGLVAGCNTMMPTVLVGLCFLAAAVLIGYGLYLVAFT